MRGFSGMERCQEMRFFRTTLLYLAIRVQLDTMNGDRYSLMRTRYVRIGGYEEFVSPFLTLSRHR